MQASSTASLATPGACFAQFRAKALARLQDTSLDKAPAGGVDAAAVPLVLAVNGHERYVTTSTCAGRCAVYAAPVGGDAKRGGRWLFSSHDGVAGDDVARALDDLDASAKSGERTWVASLKYEPPVAHVRCADLDAARALYAVAIARGYRESGVVLAKADSPVVAVRATGAAMDAPLGEFDATGRRYVPDGAHLAFLAREASRRLAVARTKLDALAAAVEAMGAPPPPPAVTTDDAAEEPRTTAAIIVPAARAKAVKTALEKGGSFDRTFSIAPAGAGSLAIPVFDGDAVDVAALEAALAGDAYTIARGARLPTARRFAKKGPTVASLVSEWASENGVKIELPRKFGRVGADTLLIPAALAIPDGASALWAAVAGAARATRVLRDAEVAPDGVRSSNRRLLFGPDAWVTVREGGVTYGFDASATMFAKGNNTERIRHGTFRAAGETVVDLYAGIGYFTLPLLLRAGAAFVHCCEWAPRTLAALGRNLEANGVARERYALHAGDNASTAPTLGRVADRVSLGLTPTSRRGWPLACAVLKVGGGVVHVHENVRIGENGPAATFAAWGAAVAEAFAAEMARDRGGAPWAATLLGVSRVKDYAPRVHHLVADVDLRPAPDSDSESIVNIP